MDPGALLATTHEVGGGLRVRLRLCRPSDALRVRAFLERLPHERHRPVTDFTFYDPRERIVIAATAPIDGTEAIVGLACPEIGVVVGDRPESRAVRELLAAAVARSRKAA
jgi:hypothetical protein